MVFELIYKGPRMYRVVKETASFLTRDGVRLVADIYRPQTEEKLPVLLMRQPYGKAIASTVVYAHPKWYAKQGFIVVIQDVRGRGESEGEFTLFEREIEDGYDTLEWVANLSGSNGKVGMYGFSYQGMTQLYAAISRHPALKTICPAMIAYDLYSDWAYENGAFCYQLNLAWAIQLATETARRKGDLSAYKILYLASRSLPIYDMPPLLEEALRKYTPGNFYYQWLSHPHPDEYWQRISPKTYSQYLDLPMLHIGGWFDSYLRGTINLYQEMRAKSKHQQCLIIAPWPHIPWGNTVAGKYYTAAANSNIDSFQVAWFNKYLKDIETPEYLSLRDGKLFQLGSNKWLNIEDLPQGGKEIIFFLKTTKGLANIRDDDGFLVTDNNHSDGEDIIVQDFWRPVNSLGGHATIFPGSCDRSELDIRSDVAIYTSDCLTEDLEIIGEVELEVYVETEAETFDLSAVLSQVFPDGKVYNFSQGHIRVHFSNKNNRNNPIRFKLQPTCVRLEKNTAIRLSVSLTSFPAYCINFGEEENYGKSFYLNAKPLTVSILSGKNNPSKLILSPFKFCR